MAQEYPSNLIPLPLREAYNRNQETGLISSQPQSGPLLKQRLSFDNPTYYNLSWVLTQSQAAIFYGWLREELDDGLKTFTIPLRNEAGVEAQAHVQFMPEGYPQLQSIADGLYSYSGQVYVRKLEQSIDGQYAAIKDLAAISPNGDWLQGANLLDEIVNVILPEV